MIDKKLKLPPQIVGNAGLFFVCHRLSQLGWNAMPTSRNARWVDVMCFSLGGKRKLLLQVKSLSWRKPPVPLGKDVENFMGDFLGYRHRDDSRKTNLLHSYPETSQGHGSQGQKDHRISYWLPRTRYAVEKFCEK